MKNIIYTIAFLSAVCVALVFAQQRPITPVISRTELGDSTAAVRADFPGGGGSVDTLDIATVIISPPGDSTAADTINAGLRKVTSAGGGTIKLKAGTYWVGDSLKCATAHDYKIVIQGEPGRTVIRSLGGTLADSVFLMYNKQDSVWQDIEFRDIIFHGGAGDNSFGVAWLDSVDSDDISFTDCRIRRFAATGATIFKSDTTSRGWSINRTEIDSCYGLQIDQGEIDLEDVFFWGSWTANKLLTSDGLARKINARNIKFSSTGEKKLTTTGYVIRLGTASNSHLYVDGLWYYGPSTARIGLFGNITARNIWMYAGGLDGGTSSGSMRITGLHAFGTANNTIDYYGTDYTLLRDLHFKDVSGNCIRLQVGSIGNVIYDASFDNVTTPISDSGSNTVVADTVTIQ